MSQQRVFRKEFGFSSGQIGECAEHKGGRWWFHPAQKTFLQRMEVETDTLFDRGVYTQHELNLYFVKMGVLKSRMNLVYCTRLSQAAASKLVPSCAIYRFHERMSQVASTGSIGRRVFRRAGRRLSRGGMLRSNAANRLFIIGIL